MIDPNKSRAAALALFDASCQNVRKIIEDPTIINPDWSRLKDAVENMDSAARHVVRVNASIKELEELQG
jgi:hypothetical protein